MFFCFLTEIENLLVQLKCTQSFIKQSQVVVIAVNDARLTHPRNLDIGDQILRDNIQTFEDTRSRCVEYATVLLP